LPRIPAAVVPDRPPLAGPLGQDLEHPGDSFTTGSSSQKELDCSFGYSGGPPGDNTQFYYDLDGSHASNEEAINVHVRFDDYGVPYNSTRSCFPALAALLIEPGLLPLRSAW
jgi:hypothetical protein